MVYVIGKLPETTILGDTFQPYAIFQNSHNGRYGVKSTICPLRFVCQNQFRYAFRNANNTVNIRHSVSVESRLYDARELLKGIYGYMGVLTDEAERLASVKIDKYQLERYLYGAFPINKNTISEKETRAQALQAFRREAFLEAYNQDDNANFRGTAWGIVNALSDYDTHKIALRKSDGFTESKFLDVTFHPVMMEMLESQIMA